jgi:hypothetical protein
MVYGPPGVGKTTFASQAPNPVFIATEEGCNDLDVARFPMPANLADVLGYIGELYAEPHEYKAVVVDSLDWLEKLVFDRVCADRRVKTIGDIDWGKGYTAALAHWKTIVEGLDALRDKRGMMVILTSHATFERFEDPETNGYDRYVPDLNRHAATLLREWCDEVLFATFSVTVREADGKFARKVSKAIGGDRILRTTQRPSAVAKNRLGMPDEIEFSWSAFSKFLNPEV